MYEATFAWVTSACMTGIGRNLVIPQRFQLPVSGQLQRLSPVNVNDALCVLPAVITGQVISSWVGGQPWIAAADLSLCTGLGGCSYPLTGG